VIAFETEGEGEPLVLLHGVGANRTIWRRAMPYIGRSRLAVAADLPGFGKSDPAGEGFDLGEVADALAAGLTEDIDAPFDLLGNSLGGAVAVVLAQRHPDLVRRLVLSAPALLAPRNGALARVAGIAGAQAIRARRLLGPPLAGSSAARHLLLWGAVGDPGRLAAEDARLMLGASRSARRIPEALATILSTDLRPALAGLRMPVALIWGGRDRVISIKTLAGIRELAPVAAVEELPEAGHVPQIERPREFAAVVERLLEKLEPVTV
jgi:pimeloyl-ACP methyl ester carboxylesterase